MLDSLQTGRPRADRQEAAGRKATDGNRSPDEAASVRIMASGHEGSPGRRGSSLCADGAQMAEGCNKYAITTPRDPLTMIKRCSDKAAIAASEQCLKRFSLRLSLNRQPSPSSRWRGLQIANLIGASGTQLSGSRCVAR